MPRLKPPTFLVHFVILSSEIHVAVATCIWVRTITLAITVHILRCRNVRA